MVKIFLRFIPILGLLIYIFGSPISADAANFQMNTGFYMGTGVAGNEISNLGFSPDYVMIIPDTTAGTPVFKTSAMAANATAFMSATADNTATQITLTATGFSVGTIANVNSVNVRYSYFAVGGSDCTSTGTFCVGQYTGNNTNPRTITTGFQPSLVILKRSTNVAAHFRTASMPANTSNYFTTTAQDTTGVLIRDFISTGFNVGSTDNVNAGIYNYIAFPTTAGIMAEGTYVGNGVDNRNVVAALGFEPDMVLVKNSNSATTNNRRSVLNITQNYGDNSNYAADAVANAVNMIQALQANGFQIGSGVNANENTNTFYWFALGGSPPLPPGSGSFTMHTGSYTGNGAIRSITGIGFKPDLVIIKGGGTQLGVFRTGMMHGDITAHLGSATADFAGGITSVTSDGFNLGTNANVNTTGVEYQYQAFGNAYDIYSRSGATNFAMGVYYGNGIDNRNITPLLFNPGIIVIKRNSTSSAVFRISANTGDQTNLFTATAQATNMLQSFTGNIFQIGTAAEVNTLGSFYRWFAFAEGTNFDVGTYTGNGVDNRDITTPGFDVALAWIKRSTNIAAVMRSNTLAGDFTQYFTATANAAGRIKTFITNGFRLETQTEVNANTGVYYYAAWRDQNPSGPITVNIVDTGGTPIGSPTVSFPAVDRKINCQTNSSVLGVSNAKIRVNNGTLNPQWNLTIAATGGVTANWDNGSGANYDFNDPDTSGCGDGADADSFTGQLSINPSIATSTPQSGCTNTGLSFGSSSAFDQGTVDSITLLTAGASAQTDCYWDITDIGMNQTIPQEQANGSYSLDFTISAIAF